MRAPEHPRGVAEGDGTALRVDDAGVQVRPFRHAGQALGGEGLVELDRGQVAPPQARSPQRRAGGIDRPDAIELGLHAAGCTRNDPGQRWAADRGKALLGRQEHRRRSVVQGRSVPGGHGATLTEGGLQRNRRDRGGGGSAAVVVVGPAAAVVVATAGTVVAAAPLLSSSFAHAAAVTANSATAPKDRARRQALPAFRPRTSWCSMVWLPPAGWCAGSSGAGSCAGVGLLQQQQQHVGVDRHRVDGDLVGSPPGRFG